MWYLNLYFFQCGWFYLCLFVNFFIYFILILLFLLQVEIESLRILKLPRTENSNNNASFILQEESCSAWPLICDPTSRVLDWLYCYLSGKLVIVKYNVSIKDPTNSLLVRLHGYHSGKIVMLCMMYCRPSY